MPKINLEEVRNIKPKRGLKTLKNQVSFHEEDTQPKDKVKRLHKAPIV